MSEIGRQVHAEMRNMFRDAEENFGVRPWAYESLTFFNYTTEYPSGDSLGTAIVQEQNEAIDFFTHRYFRDSGIVFADTSRALSDTSPSPFDGNIIVRYRTDVGPGNFRYPQTIGVMTAGSCWISPGYNYNTRLLELGRVLGIAEGIDGSNSNGFSIEGSTIVDLNDLGKRAFVHSNVHGPEDFRY